MCIRFNFKPHLDIANMADLKEHQKRKKVILTIENKIDICNKLEHGESRAKIMKEYGIGSSTVYDIRKQKDELHKFYSTSESTNAIKQRKTLRKPKLEQLDTILYEWCVIKRLEGSPISGPILREKAKEFYEKMELTEECAFSEGWLAGFKSRHGMRKLDISDEQKSSDSNAVKEYTDTFAKLAIINSLSPEQIYNAHETGLFWRSLPNKALAEEKSNKDRFTVLCCANAAGTHRIKLLVVGDDQRPRSFKNVQLPVQYAAQSNAWMNKDIFKNWFFHTFVPSVKEHFVGIGLPENSKCILLLDNSNAHPSEMELCSGNIFVKYLPSNVTAFIQPMSQGVIQNMKCFYRRNFLRKLVNYEGTIKTFQDSFNMKDAIFNVACAWSLVKKETLRLAWKKLLQPVNLGENTPNLENTIVDADDHREEIVSLFRNVTSLNYEDEITPEEVLEWLKNDKESATTDTTTEDDLIDSVLYTEPQNFPNESSDAEETTNENVSWESANEAYKTLIKFAERKPCHSAQEVVQLHLLHSSFLQKRHERIKETELRKKIKFRAQQEAAGIHVTIQKQETSGPSFEIKEEITIDETVLENYPINPKLEPFETTSAGISEEGDPLEEVEIHNSRETVPQSTYSQKRVVSPNTPPKTYSRKRKISDINSRVEEDNDFLKTIKVKIETGDEHVDYGMYIANRFQNSNQGDRAIAMAKQKIELILSDLDTGIFENSFY